MFNYVCPVIWSSFVSMKVFRKGCTVLVYFVYCVHGLTIRLRKTEVMHQPAQKQASRYCLYRLFSFYTWSQPDTDLTNLNIFYIMPLIVVFYFARSYAAFHLQTQDIFIVTLNYSLSQHES
jgi:hypothetical protein